MQIVKNKYTYWKKVSRRNPVKEEIDVIKTSIQTLDKQHVKVMADAEEATQKTRKASLFQLMRQTTENIRELRSDLNNKQEKMAKLMAKKPKLM